MIHETTSRFGVADYVVLSVILLMTIFVGLYFSFRHGKSLTLVEYFIGSRQMGILPVAMSLVASFQSVFGILGLTTEIYLFGAACWYRNCAFLAAVPIIAYCYLPVFYNLKLTSVFEYLERRFNSTLRKVGSLSGIVILTLITSFMLYGSSLVLMQVTGLNFWMSVIVTDIIATFYTTLGGIRAVMWTDVLQVTILFISLLTCTIQGVIDVGGFGHVFKEAWNNGLMDISAEIDFRVRYTIWNVAISAVLNVLSVNGIDQMNVQRFSSSTTLQSARKSFFIYMISNYFFSFLWLLAGLVIYVKYHDCDPLLTRKINKADQMIVLFVIETLQVYPGLGGLFVGGLLCAALSTISSSLNSISALVFEDFLKQNSKFNISTTLKPITISKITTAIFGIVALMFVVVLDNLGTIIQTFLYIANVFSGVNLGLFSLGMFIPWANSFGATVGILLGTIIAQWISISSQMHPPFTKRLPGSVTGCSSNETINFNFTNPLSSSANNTQSDIFPLHQVAFSWIIFFSFVPVIVFGMIFSAIYKPSTTPTLDTRLIAPVIRRYLAKPTNDQVQVMTSVVPEQAIKCAAEKRLSLDQQTSRVVEENQLI